MMDEELFNQLKKGDLFYEMEWFGIDKIGQLGAFIASQNAYVPEEVWKSYENYGNTLNYFIRRLKEKSNQTILDSIGNQDYIEYAEVGLFAFDSALISESNQPKRYQLIESPTHPINIVDLTLRKNLVEALPQLDVVFGDPYININTIAS